MPEPIGCNDEDARAFLGCSPTAWEQLKARRVVVPLRRGWYSYRMLEDAMRKLEAAASVDETKRKLKVAEGGGAKPPKTQDMIQRLRESASGT